MDVNTGANIAPIMPGPTPYVASTPQEEPGNNLPARIPVPLALGLGEGRPGARCSSAELRSVVVRVFAQATHPHRVIFC